MTPLSAQEIRHRIATSEKLAAAKIKSRVLVGLDGYLDSIIHLVDQRQGVERFQRLQTMDAFANRVAINAGKSCNIEMVVQQIKLGGNGPLMASALGSLGAEILYVGAVGFPQVAEIFQVLEQWGRVVSLCDPAFTDAVEFDDGKVMFGKAGNMNKVTWERILECFGGAEKLRAEIASCTLIALTNWTQLPYSTEIYCGFFELTRGRKDLFFFFDLADPSKRPQRDLQAVIELFGETCAAGAHVILGLNHGEALKVAAVLGIKDVSTGDSAEEVTQLARGIQQTSGINEIVVHPRALAAAAAGDEVWSVTGPFTPKPKLSTGAGDNFNGGYCFGRLLGFTPQDALITGVAASGYYVRNGRGATSAELSGFLRNWADDALD